MKPETFQQETRKPGKARRCRLLLPGFLASCFLSGCAADGSFDAQGFGRAVGALAGAVSDYRANPENGPDTRQTGFYDSDGIWRTNFGP